MWKCGYGTVLTQPGFVCVLKNIQMKTKLNGNNNNVVVVKAATQIYPVRTPKWYFVFIICFATTYWVTNFYTIQLVTKFPSGPPERCWTIFLHCNKVCQLTQHVGSQPKSLSFCGAEVSPRSVHYHAAVREEGSKGLQLVTATYHLLLNCSYLTWQLAEATQTEQTLGVSDENIRFHTNSICSSGEPLYQTMSYSSVDQYHIF